MSERRLFRLLPVLLLSVLVLCLQGARPVPSPVEEIALPLKANSVRFAVIGDMGTGERPQYEVSQQMTETRKRFPFEFVIMLGDNIYGGSSPRDYDNKFTRPYKPLIDAQVNFYASLGNHDNTNERFFKLFNMNGRQYYTFKKGNVRLFALDSNYMKPDQLTWLTKELEGAGSDWKIAYFHHPLYSSARTHGPATDLRLLLEPLFVKYGVQVVFAGHEHVYERLKPQKGIHYFVEGSSGQLRPGDLNPSANTAFGFDTDRAFMVVEVAGDELYFQTISRTGRVVDSGVIKRPPAI
jgi:predicted phosphodiesterase